MIMYYYFYLYMRDRDGHNYLIIQNDVGILKARSRKPLRLHYKCAVKKKVTYVLYIYIFFLPYDLFLSANRLTKIFLS